MKFILLFVSLIFFIACGSEESKTTFESFPPPSSKTKEPSQPLPSEPTKKALELSFEYEPQGDNVQAFPEDRFWKFFIHQNFIEIKIKTLFKTEEELHIFYRIDTYKDEQKQMWPVKALKPLSSIHIVFDPEKYPLDVNGEIYPGYQLIITFWGELSSGEKTPEYKTHVVFIKRFPGE